MTSRNGTAITWNSDNLPTQITESGSNASSFAYAPDKHRYYQSAVINGVTETTVYAGAFEAVTSGGVTTYRYHLSADEREVAEVDLSNSGSTVTETVSYILSDHLGSVDVVQSVNQNTGIVTTTDMSFSAFGHRREPGTWEAPVGTAEIQTDHDADRYGFTHQEMLDNVNLIHMNGRVYGPSLGRFLSVDPVFEFPTNTQSLNPYSYVLNNPLSLTDPTGYVAGSCGTGKTSCPASSTMKPGDSAEKTFTPTGSHIAIHITATVQANGDVAISSNNTQVAQSLASAATRMFGGGNGAQNSAQGPGTGLALSNSGNQGGNTAPAFNATVASSNSATTGNTVTGTNGAEETKLLNKTWADLPSAIKFWDRTEPVRSERLAQYAKDKIDIRQGFAPGQSAADCATGCEPGYAKGNSIVLYAGAALAAGYTTEGGSHGTMFIIGHEFRHTTLVNQQKYYDYRRQNPDVSTHWIEQQENGPPSKHDALPWENDANEYGRHVAEAYDLIHPQ